jgi:hypothetical protein
LKTNPAYRVYQFNPDCFSCALRGWHQRPPLKRVDARDGRWAACSATINSAGIAACHSRCRAQLWETSRRNCRRATNSRCAGRRERRQEPSLRAAQATKQSIVRLRRHGMFAESVAGRRFAPTRWIAMTRIDGVSAKHDAGGGASTVGAPGSLRPMRPVEVVPVIRNYTEDRFNARLGC